MPIFSFFFLCLISLNCIESFYATWCCLPLMVSFFMNFVAEKLGISSPPPYLSLSQNDDAVLKGVNYASGGAGILNDTGLYFVIIRSFKNDLFLLSNWLNNFYLISSFTVLTIFLNILDLVFCIVDSEIILWWSDQILWED